MQSSLKKCPVAVAVWVAFPRRWIFSSCCMQKQNVDILFAFLTSLLICQVRQHNAVQEGNWKAARHWLHCLGDCATCRQQHCQGKFDLSSWQAVGVRECRTQLRSTVTCMCVWAGGTQQPETSVVCRRREELWQSAFVCVNNTRDICAASSVRHDAPVSEVRSD